MASASASSSSHRPNRFTRALAALLCLPLLAPTAHAAPAIWPRPQIQPVRPAQPGFQAPSAMSCERQVEARVVPGGGNPRQSSVDRAAVSESVSVTGSRIRAERSDRAEGAVAAAEAKSTFAPPVAMALPPPSPAPAPVVADSRLSRPSPPLREAPQQSGPVTAGVVDDNADFGEYLAFRARTQVTHRERDVRERYLLEVKDAAGRAVPDAEIAVQSATGAAMWARTDSAGRAWLHPDAFDASGRAASYQVTGRKAGAQATTTLKRGQKSTVELRLDTAPPQTTQNQRARLDLVFLVDATGSMGDEIGKLKSSLQSIVADINGLPSRPDLCLGLVAYRDRGDEYLLKAHDLSQDVNGFQRALDQLQAGGGGDTPEAMNEAFNDTVHNISWRGEGATRLVVLLADAPPHLDYGGPQYDDDMLAALGKGIKVFSVGASGLDRQGEYIQRQIAQYTGGRFVFLTYADARRPGSGPGRETVHDVQNYSVQTLDKLIVRLVSQELAALK